jgi:hypothetical protein
VARHERAGLLGERQQIQHAKAFKKAKKCIGVPMKTRSVLCDLKPADGASCVFEVSSRELKDTVVEALIVRWLNDNPAPSLPGRCAWCGKVEMPDVMLLPYGAEPGTHTWLHSECWPSWQAARRATALSAVCSERHEIHSGHSTAAEIQPLPLVSQTAQAISTLDEPNAAPRGITPHFDDNGRFIHPCCCCGKPAVLGFGVNLRAGKLGTWYCGGCKPDPKREEHGNVNE